MSSRKTNSAFVAHNSLPTRQGIASVRRGAFQDAAPYSKDVDHCRWRRRLAFRRGTLRSRRPPNRFPFSVFPEGLLYSEVCREAPEGPSEAVISCCFGFHYMCRCPCGFASIETASGYFLDFVFPLFLCLEKEKKETAEGGRNVKLAFLPFSFSSVSLHRGYVG